MAFDIIQEQRSRLFPLRAIHLREAIESHDQKYLYRQSCKLECRHRQLPNGMTVDLEIVRHPGAAAVVPLKDDGTVILIRQFRHAAGGFIYEIPAGKLHPGEDPRTARHENLRKKSDTEPAV